MLDFREQERDASDCRSIVHCLLTTTVRHSDWYRHRFYPMQDDRWLRRRFPQLISIYRFMNTSHPFRPVSMAARTAGSGLVFVLLIRYNPARIVAGSGRGSCQGSLIGALPRLRQKTLKECTPRDSERP